MNHKQQIRLIEQMKNQAYTEKRIDEVLRSHIVVSLLVLGDKFGFGKKRMERYLNYIAQNTFSLAEERKQGNITTTADIEKILKEEYKFDLNNCITTIIKNEEK